MNEAIGQPGEGTLPRPLRIGEILSTAFQLYQRHWRTLLAIAAVVVEGRRGSEAMGRSWELVGGHWWHAFFTLVVAGLLTGVVNAVITAPFGNAGWFVQAIAAAVATVITLPYGVLAGVLLYLDLRARKENLNMERLRSDLQASAT